MTTFEILKDAEERISAIEGEQVEVIYRRRRVVPVNRLKDALCAVTGLTWSEILIKKRKPDYAHARQAFCYLAYVVIRIRYSAIAEHLNRDYNYVLNSKMDASRALKKKKKFLEFVNSVRAKAQI